ncbi:MAG: hypothetical protein GXP62_07355, partial [Oligoflexia bacterium]|nr:hypothetical protein [Oligoflexia bacterium]
WIHIPGAWWGAIDAALSSAIATGDDPQILAAALARATQPAAPPTPTPPPDNAP